MNKKFVLFMTLAAAGLSTMAQISQGDPHSTNIRTGNRPVAGTWGIFVGPSYGEIKDLVDWTRTNGDIDIVRGLPLVNVKRYASDHMEWRLGIQYYATAYRNSGHTAGYSSNQVSMADSKSFFRLTPGVAHHFSSRNLLDVYVGAYMPIGYEGYTDKSEFGTYYQTLTRGSFVLGLGTFIGVQAFVADLPFSIGFEYGLDGVLHMGRNDKIVTTDATGGKQTSYAPYGTGSPSSSSPYSSLSGLENSIGSNIRITFSYYFSNK